MNFWTSDNVIQVHCELSTFCNAACPQCPRFVAGTKILRPGLELEQITLEKFKKYFDPEFIKKSTMWIFCGTHGDPMMAKDSVKIIEYLYSFNNPDLKVRLNTNGGIRSQKDWETLGRLSASTSETNNFTITFSIDGLEDTNHLYRRNVDWNTLIKNVRAYRKAGGKAEWDFLVFKHNQHQIEEARQLAIKLGFNKFIPKRALGFEYGGEVKDLPVWDEDGNYEYTIEAPTLTEYTNFTPEQIKKTKKQSTESFVHFYKNNRDNLKIEHNKNVQEWDQKTWRDEPVDYSPYNNKTIKCKSNTIAQFQNEKIEGREIFVNANGIMMPCCYVGTELDVTYKTIEIYQLQRKLREYGIENFNLNEKSMTQILKEGHLNRVFADSWEKSCNDRILYCAFTCGENNRIDRIWTDKT
jgi:hypothetical protein